MGFSFRIVTKAQTNLRDDIKEYLNKFYFIIRNIIKEKNLLVHRENIGNADETPIFLEMNLKKTLNVIGDKEIKVKSFNKTHIRISVLLTILANGKSLKPFVVFKGKPKGFKERQLNAHPKAKAGYIFVCCQENSWVDEPTMRRYLSEIWFQEGIFKTKKNTLLEMDRARSHFSKEIDDLFKENDANYVLIPPGMTSVVQPLDTHVNKVFKSNIRNGYHKWLIKNKNSVINESDIIDFIFNAWFNIDQKKQEYLIEKSFRDNGITLKTDGTEDAEYLKIQKEYYDLLNIVSNVDVDDDIFEKDLDDLVDKNEEPLYIYNGNIKERKNNIKNSNNYRENILDYFKLINEDREMDIDEE